MKQSSNDQTTPNNYIFFINCLIILKNHSRCLTEIETENLYEINHADLSQISQVKEDPKLTLQLKLNGEFINLNCTFETFDSTMNILNSTYTFEKLKKLKYICCQIFMIKMKTVLEDSGVQRNKKLLSFN